MKSIYYQIMTVMCLLVFSGFSDLKAAAIPVPGKIEAESYTTMSGVQVEACSDVDGGSNVGFIETNDWMEYNIQVASAGTYDFTFRSASLGAGGMVKVLVDGVAVNDGLALPITGGWQTWKSTTLRKIALPAGNHTLRLIAVAGGFNLNYINTSAYVANAAMGYLRADGKNIVNNFGNFQLRSANIGNYMIQEGYMLNLGGGYQHVIKQKIADVIGTTNMNTHYTNYRENYLTKADIDSLAAWGFNSIRLPMHYNLFTVLGSPDVFLESGFQKVDQIISWCKANGIYVILDLHAAPGGQNSGDISDYIAGQPSLWESAANREQTVKLWKKFAERYANEEIVGGYDLINETNWTLPGNTLLANLMKDITTAIRTVDNNHILFIEGNSYANDYTGLTPKWDNNMAYSFHKYWNDVNDGSITFVTSIRDSENVPIWLGEFGENSNHWVGNTVELMNKYNIGWAVWPYKKMGSVSGPMAFKEPDNWSTLAAYINGTGAKPSASVGQAILDEMVENVKVGKCSVNKGFLFALFPNNQTPTKPFESITLPDTLFAAKYDEGKNGVAYSDLVFQTSQFGAGGGNYTAWNTGWYYRNDGVDLQYSNAEKGPIVAWTEDNEWMNYTVNVNRTSTYAVKARVAGNGGKISLTVDGVPQVVQANLLATGGWDSWTSQAIGTLTLTGGNHTIKVTINTSGFNLSHFTIVDANPPVPAITLANSNKTYGDAPFTVAASSNSTGIFTYSITTGTSFAAINPNTGTVTILGAGTAIVKVDQAATNSFAAGSKTMTLAIAKKSLTATATGKTRAYNSANPAFTFTYAGFVNGETASVLDVLPTATTSAIISSNAGTYAIVPSGGQDNNYNFNYVNGALTVTAINANLSITSTNSGKAGSFINLTSSSNSNAAVSWSVISGNGSVSGSTLYLLGTGNIVVQASQAATTNYLAATAQQTISVSAINPNLTITSTNSGQAGSFINLTSSSNSNAAISWSVISGNGSVSGSTLYLLGAGNVVVQASQTANTNYLAATAQQTIAVSAKSIPTISFSNVVKTYGDAPFTVSASSNSTGAITYNILSGNNLASINPSSGLVNILGAGAVTLQVSQASIGTFDAGTATATLTINKATRTFTITSADFGDAGSQINLLGIANPNATIDWSVNNGTGTASVSGSSLALLTAGLVTVNASIPADDNYFAASASQVVAIQAVVTGISSELINQGVFLSAYPNPFELESKLQLELSADALVSIQVLNMMGVPVVSISENENLKSGIHSFQIENIPAATYLVKAVVNDKVYLLRLVKQ